METDYLIVGAGFFGAVIANKIANELKKKVLIVEKRDHIGGNCYSKIDEETGIEHHVYGTHIFHTNSKNVFEYLSQFTEFNSYYHQVLTTHNDRVYQMPINLETINSFYGVNLKPFEVDDFLAEEKAKEQYPKPKNLEEKAISLIGRPLYEAFIKGYTQKQWQKDPSELPASIINRLPVRNNYDESYFNNGRYQGIPLDGYTAIFERMLDHKLITVKTSTDYFSIKDNIKVKEKTIYSGPIDHYFNYTHGHLDWRSVRFERVVSPHKDFQGTSVMNFADESPAYTRIHEPRHLHPERNYTEAQSLLFYEYSETNPEEPYYPVNNEENKVKLERYQELAKKEDKVLFGGRLGTYSYYDMDQVIGQALSLFETQIKS
jgi:UDP-galactopyranose mutase